VSRKVDGAPEAFVVKLVSMVFHHRSSCLLELTNPEGGHVSNRRWRPLAELTTAKVVVYIGGIPSDRYVW
jgi:hypothetical protein